MQFEETQDGDITIVSVCGDLDTYTVPEFKERIQRLLGEGRLKLVFDLEELRYICSAGVAVLISWSERIHTRGGYLAVCGMQGRVSETFHILHLDHSSTVLGIFGTRGDALAEIRAL